MSRLALETPMPGFWAYERIVFRRAVRDFGTWVRTNVPISMFATLAAIIAFTTIAAFAPKPFEGVNVLQEALVALCEGIGGTFLLAIAVFVLFWGRSDHKIYWESQRQIDSLAGRLTPKLKLSFPEQYGIVHMNRGHMQEMANGRRQALYTQLPEIVLRIACTNESDTRVVGCRAWLVDVKRIRDDGTLEDVGFPDAVELLWSRDLAAQEFVAELQPSVPKSIYVLARRNGTAFVLWRQTREIPIEYAILFNEGSKFRVWIRVNGQDDVGDKICLDIDALGGPTVPPLPGIGVRVVAEN